MAESMVVSDAKVHSEKAKGLEDVAMTEKNRTVRRRLVDQATEERIKALELKGIIGRAKKP